MALLDDRSREAVKGMLGEGMQRPVHVDLYVGADNEEASQFSRDLLSELAAIEERLTWTEHALDDEARGAGMESSPTLVIGRELGYRVEYWGAPLGMEAQGFLEAIVLASRGSSDLSAESQELLALVEREVRAYAFVTPTCPHCPPAAKLNHQMAIARPGLVRSICVEASQNQELARRYRVSSVPQQIINEDQASASVGAQPESRMVRQVAEYGASDPAAVVAVEEAIRAARTTFIDDPGRPLDVTDDSFDEALARYPLLVVDFWAEWCGPCRMVAPVVSALADEMKGRVVFGKLDTEANQATAARYRVTSIPSLIVFKDGKEVDRIVGARPKAALQQEIEKHVSLH